MAFNQYLNGNKQFGWDEYDPSWEWINTIFTPDEVSTIKELKKDYKFGRGVTVGADEKTTNTNTRESKTFFIEQDDTTRWIYDKIAWNVASVNEKKWRYVLTDMEHIQYSQYLGPDVMGIDSKIGIRTHRDKDQGRPGHYNWHIDGGYNVANRKISIVVPLSDPGDYEGGKLKTLFSDGEITHSSTPGCCILFPSFVLHKVEPVESGIRESLVCWIKGPTFR